MQTALSCCTDCKLLFRNSSPAACPTTPAPGGCAPELIVPDKLTGKRAYLHRMQHTEICVASTGLHGSTGWKLAEYVAAGRAIVTEPLRYTLPGGFEEGKKSIKHIRPQAECEAQLRQLLADPAAILAMAQHNAAYYQTWLRPEQQVRQALRQLEIGKCKGAKLGYGRAEAA